MPPHLHPRSRMTSSLFATTVLTSFLVVALPHVLPCPAPRRIIYADGVSPDVIEVVDENGQRRMRRRRRKPDTSREHYHQQHPFYRRYHQETSHEARGAAQFGNDGLGDNPSGDDEEHRGRATKRECPMPKPGGIVGRWLGFEPKSADENKKLAKAEVRIEQWRKEER